VRLAKAVRELALKYPIRGSTCGASAAELVVSRIVVSNQTKIFCFIDLAPVFVSSTDY
jgi:hypothetical protein